MFVLNVQAKELDNHILRKVLFRKCVYPALFHGRFGQKLIFYCIVIELASQKLQLHCFRRHLYSKSVSGYTDYSNILVIPSHQILNIIFVCEVAAPQNDFRCVSIRCCNQPRIGFILELTPHPNKIIFCCSFTLYNLRNL